MARIKISELLKNGVSFLGEKLEVKGWVRAFRSKRFVQLNDGSCMANIQGVIDFDKFSVLLDSMSYPYLYGSTLDFIEDLSGSKFVIKNPNAKTTCGCGESFTI